MGDERVNGHRGVGIVGVAHRGAPVLGDVGLRVDHLLVQQQGGGQAHRHLGEGGTAQLVLGGEGHAVLDRPAPGALQHHRSVLDHGGLDAHRPVVRTGLGHRLIQSRLRDGGDGGGGRLRGGRGRSRNGRKGDRRGGLRGALRSAGGEGHTQAQGQQQRNKPFQQQNTPFFPLSYHKARKKERRAIGNCSFLKNHI